MTGFEFGRCSTLGNGCEIPIAFFSLTFLRERIIFDVREKITRENLFALSYNRLAIFFVYTVRFFFFFSLFCVNAATAVSLRIQVTLLLSSEIADSGFLKKVKGAVIL